MITKLEYYKALEIIDLYHRQNQLTDIKIDTKTKISLDELIQYAEKENIRGRLVNLLYLMRRETMPENTSKAPDWLIYYLKRIDINNITTFDEDYIRKAHRNIGNNTYKEYKQLVNKLFLEKESK